MYECIIVASTDLMCLRADKIGMINIWHGSTSVSCDLTFAAGIDAPLISMNTLRIVPTLFQIVPGLKGSKTEDCR